MDDRDSLQHLLSDTSQVQLILEGVNTLIQDQDITGMSGFIPWNNPELFQQNTNFNGHQSFSHAPSVQENTVDAGLRNGTGIPNRQFMTNQISLSPHLRNYFINPHMTWDSQGMEPYVQPTLVPLPMMPAEPHVYSRLSMHPNYHAQLSQLYDNQNNQYHSRGMIPNGHMEQSIGTLVQPSGRSMQVVDERNDVHNQLLDVPNLQGQSSTLFQRTSSLSGSQVMGSRIMGLSGIASLVQMPESSRLLRQERASSIQQQQVAPASSNRPTIWKNWKGKNGEEYVPPRRGRPRKRFEVGESSKCPKQQKIEKESSGTENVGPTPTQEANNASENVRNEVQNANPTSPSPSAPIQRDIITNGLYGLRFERNGVPSDPHLRIFKGLPEN